MGPGFLCWDNFSCEEAEGWVLWHDLLSVTSGAGPILNLFIVTACFLVYFWSGLTGYLTALYSKIYKDVDFEPCNYTVLFLDLGLLFLSPSHSCGEEKGKNLGEENMWNINVDLLIELDEIFPHSASELKVTQFLLNISISFLFIGQISCALFPYIMGTKSKVMILCLLSCIHLQ